MFLDQLGTSDINIKEQFCKQNTNSHSCQPIHTSFWHSKSFHITWVFSSLRHFRRRRTIFASIWSFGKKCNLLLQIRVRQNYFFWHPFGVFLASCGSPVSVLSAFLFASYGRPLGVLWEFFGRPFGVVFDLKWKHFIVCR